MTAACGVITCLRSGRRAADRRARRHHGELRSRSQVPPWISAPPCGAGCRGRSRAPAPDCQRVRVPARRRRRAWRPICRGRQRASARPARRGRCGSRLRLWRTIRRPAASREPGPARSRARSREITSGSRCARRSMSSPAALCLARETRTVRPISRRSTMPRSESSPMIPDAARCGLLPRCWPQAGRPAPRLPPEREQLGAGPWLRG